MFTFLTLFMSISWFELWMCFKLKSTKIGLQDAVIFLFYINCLVQVKIFGKICTDVRLKKLQNFCKHQQRRGCGANLVRVECELGAHLQLHAARAPAARVLAASRVRTKLQSSEQCAHVHCSVQRAHLHCSGHRHANLHWCICIAACNAKCNAKICKTAMFAFERCISISRYYCGGGEGWIGRGNDSRFDVLIRAIAWLSCW